MTFFPPFSFLITPQGVSGKMTNFFLSRLKTLTVTKRESEIKIEDNL